jgi:hypothetical protein
LGGDALAAVASIDVQTIPASEVNIPVDLIPPFCSFFAAKPRGASRAGQSVSEL